MEEILAMGGDPFFMVGDDFKNDNSKNNNIEDFDKYMEQKEAQEELIAEIEAAGGDPFFLLDNKGSDDAADQTMIKQLEQERMMIHQKEEERIRKEITSSDSESRSSDKSTSSPLSAS